MVHKKFLIFLFLLTHMATIAENSSKKTVVYMFSINKEIGPAIWRVTKQSFDEAKRQNAALIIIHMNTYGGMVNYADSIRTIILNSLIPVYVFIDNNAASAGALISIACKKIYMRKGANIGAATVVTQDGKPAPDKYQSYMRSMMRATAEAHGKDTIISGADTLFKWKRDPLIAQAMVGFTDGDSSDLRGAVLTLTTDEAIQKGFCEGIAANIPEILQINNIAEYMLVEYRYTPFEKVMGFLVNPVLQGILIMLIIAGIYFEMQSPGIGFPLIIAVSAALLYFAPLYLEGLAKNWEILVFVAGMVLLGLEIFVLPGFGVAGIAGVTLMVLGLSLSMIDNITIIPESYILGHFIRAVGVVFISIILSFFFSLLISKRMATKPGFSRLILEATQNRESGFIGADMNLYDLIGKTAIAATILRPSGRISIGTNQYDAIAEYGFIEKGTIVKITRFEAGQLYVISLPNS